MECNGKQSVTDKPVTYSTVTGSDGDGCLGQQKKGRRSNIYQQHNNKVFKVEQCIIITSHRSLALIGQKSNQKSQSLRITNACGVKQERTGSNLGRDDVKRKLGHSLTCGVWGGRVSNPPFLRMKKKGCEVDCDAIKSSLIQFKKD